MYNTIEINLEPTPQQSSRKSATYEEAFLGGGTEEMSDAKGRGRARRKKRKLERVGAKREVRTERRKLKSDRGEERIARRRKRTADRQVIRGERQDARMERRNKRREDRESRRGKEDEGTEEEEETQTTQQPTGGGSSQESESSAPAPSQGEEETSQDEEDAGYDDETSEDEESEEATGNYDFDGESSQFLSEATGQTQVSPLIQDICLRIEWNNEMLMRLANKKKEMLSQGRDVTAINGAIDNKFDRVQSLEGKLENFSGANGRKDKRKAKEVELGRKKARQERLRKATNVIPPDLMARLLKKGLTKLQIKEWWETKGKKRFGNSSFDGADDLQDRVHIVDEPVDASTWGMPSGEIDIDLGAGDGHDPMSFATGETSGSNTFWKSLVIGLLVGGTLIYVVRKYKLLK